jgi:hypothetical protein
MNQRISDLEKLLRKIDEKRMVTHEHNSVPFDVESGKASLDFKP